MRQQERIRLGKSGLVGVMTLETAQYDAKIIASPVTTEPDFMAARCRPFHLLHQLLVIVYNTIPSTRTSFIIHHTAIRTHCSSPESPHQYPCRAPLLLIHSHNIARAFLLLLEDQKLDMRFLMMKKRGLFCCYLLSV